MQEDNAREIEEIVPDEGPLPQPKIQDLIKLENWVHFTPNILKVGRLSHMDPEVPEG